MNRISIQPFLSGDTFRLDCNYICDETRKWPDLSRVKRNNIIFVKTDYLQLFYKVSKRFIREPFILVTHNSDHKTSILSTSERQDLLSRCIWFGQNNDSPEITSIPIGLANSQWSHCNPEKIFRLLPQTCEDVEKLFQKPKTNLVYMGITSATNPRSREPVIRHFEKLGISNKSLDWEEYVKQLQDTYFCVCPEGNGPDTHRVWESLYCGCIPIVLSTTTPDLFKDLPVLPVGSWDSITIDLLLTKLNAIKKGSYPFEKLFYPYWKTRLTSKSL